MPIFALVFHGFRFLGLNNKGWSSLVYHGDTSFLICFFMFNTKLCLQLAY